MQYPFEKNLYFHCTEEFALRLAGKGRVWYNQGRAGRAGEKLALFALTSPARHSMIRKENGSGTGDMGEHDCAGN